MSDTALKLAPRSIATSSAVILSPEVAQMPREVATVVPRSSKPCTAYTAIGDKLCEDEVKNRSLHVKNRSLAKLVTHFASRR